MSVSSLFGQRTCLPWLLLRGLHQTLQASRIGLSIAPTSCDTPSLMMDWTGQWIGSGFGPIPGFEGTREMEPYGSLTRQVETGEKREIESSTDVCSECTPSTSWRYQFTAGPAACRRLPTSKASGSSGSIIPTRSQQQRWTGPESIVPPTEVLAPAAASAVSVLQTKMTLSPRPGLFPGRNALQISSQDLLLSLRHGLI